MMVQECKISPSDSAADGPRVACCDLESELSVELFKALSEPNRAAILGTLATTGGQRTVGEIAECCTVDLSVVSRHLAVLRDAGILEAQKRGREVRYRLLVKPLADYLRRLADSLEACCPPREESDT
ncbi:MAG: metalloregulator ArsR/SmtB family transcription factor [Thermoleophilia bacterium]|nr:metalloregulator ArsR/SmtB family transcription factor [Thermoleophilia bacterium]